ncbi:oxygenase MpaB family protein [Mycobacteroides abscessus]|uniref:oxygenase MpaB family protein n=1 Tax=Mycobacteroides abscessus TaxID=36809 RepID=UPI000C265001|nr:oxygenase MpaB family protein [Mycobacteroides abscessus]
MDEVVNRASSITGAHNWSAVRDQHPREVDAMAHGLDIGDPLADSVITEMFASGDLAWPDIVAMLDRPDTSRALPPALSAFLTSAKTTPAWYQPTLAAAGAQAWWRFGSLQSSTLYQSLIYGYQARGFTRPLVETGRLSTGTWDRVLATARWVALATAPGLMEPGGAGWVETLRIRLVHAMVRHHLRARQGWNDEQWGVPINQTYSQLTITAGFLILPLRVAEDFGIRYSSADLEAITHLWRWIGWVMGVRDELLPCSYSEALLTYEIAREFRMEPATDGKVLVQALLKDGYRTELGLPGRLDDLVFAITKPILSTVFGSISTRWVDPDVACALGLRSSPLHRLVDLARPIVRSRELVRALGFLGPEHQVAQRELKMITARLGLDLSGSAPLASRYDSADKGHLETVA